MAQPVGPWGRDGNFQHTNKLDGRNPFPKEKSPLSGNFRFPNDTCDEENPGQSSVNIPSTTSVIPHNTS